MGIIFGHRMLNKPDGSTKEGWKAYKCGHCGHDVSGAVVAWGSDENGYKAYWLQCPKCGDGSFIDRYDKLFPGAKFGPVIEGLPEDIKQAYQEARDCLAVNATTASELICRKILMHVAVD